MGPLTSLGRRPYIPSGAGPVDLTRPDLRAE